MVISPYVIRNYIHFNQVIIVKSLGYNLWKGNNQLSTVEGYGKLEIEEFKNLPSTAQHKITIIHIMLNSDNFSL